MTSPAFSMSQSSELAWMKRTLISPAGSPRDARDAGLTIVCGLLLLLFIAAAVLLPATIAWLLTERTSLAYLAGMIIFVGLIWSLINTVVHWLKIDAFGLTFGRRAGGPRHLAWEEIRSITPASRREVVLHGWLWPPFRPREATRCQSSLGHYRIEYAGGYCFFPPRQRGGIPWRD
jgi:hypothetical protein